jgi:ATP-dependent Zn protease
MADWNALFFRLETSDLWNRKQRPTEDRFLLAESDLKNRVVVLMGGRAAEKLVFAGDVSTGAADDLQRATEIALEMVTRHGLLLKRETLTADEFPAIRSVVAEDRERLRA